MLTDNQPLNYKECWRFLNRSDLECLHQLKGPLIRKWARIGGQTCLFDLSEQAEDRIAVQMRIGNPAQEKLLEDYIRVWWDLDRDLRPFEQLAKKDLLLGPLWQSFRHLRVIGIPDLFEALCWSVIGQQINLNFAYSLKKRMVEKWGEAFTFEGETYYHFPRPEEIARLSTADFKPFQFSVRKAEYIIGIAQLMVAGELSKEALIDQSSEAIIDRLLKIRGIGNWTAQYVLMKCFQRAEAFPLQDAGLHNAIKRLQGRDQKPSLAEITALAKPWKGWEGYATFYLWQSLLSEK